MSLDSCTSFEFNGHTCQAPQLDVAHYMGLALNQAKLALQRSEVPVGCVFVAEDGTVLSSGHNETNLSRNGTRHAELVAMDDLFLRRRCDAAVLKNSSLFVTCEPCIMCAAAIAKVGVKQVYFGCHNDRFGGNGSILSVHKAVESSTHQYSVQSGVLKEEAIAIFQQFYETENRRAPEGKRRKKGK